MAVKVKQIFMGSSHTKKECDKLTRLLESTFGLISGVQQTEAYMTRPDGESKKHMLILRREVKKDKQTIKDNAVLLFERLTGEKFSRTRNKK